MNISHNRFYFIHLMFYLILIILENIVATQISSTLYPNIFIHPSLWLIIHTCFCMLGCFYCVIVLVNKEIYRQHPKYNLLIQHVGVWMEIGWFAFGLFFYMLHKYVFTNSLFYLIVGFHVSKWIATYLLDHSENHYFST